MMVGVEGAVGVGLGRADIVFEAPGQHVVAAVDDAQRRVAVGDALDDDPEGHDVGELLEAYVLAFHLAPDGERRLLAAGDLGTDAGGGQRGAQRLDDAVDLLGVVAAQAAQPVDDAGPLVGLQLGEGQILELRPQAIHADALGERRIDLHRLGGDAAALGRVLDEVERAHVVQTVRELHQKHADVLRHREQELPEVLGLRGLGRLKLELVELGDAVDEASHHGPEEARDLLDRGAGVLHRVVEQSRRDRGAVELEAGQDAGHLDGVVEIGIAGRSELGPMRLHGEDVGPVQEVLVGVGIVPLDALDELVLPHDRAAAGLPWRRDTIGRGHRRRGRRCDQRERLGHGSHQRLPLKSLPLDVSPRPPHRTRRSSPRRAWAPRPPRPRAASAHPAPAGGPRAPPSSSSTWRRSPWISS